MSSSLTFDYTPVGLTLNTTKYISGKYISSYGDMVFVGEKSGIAYQFCSDSVTTSSTTEIKLMGDGGATVFPSKNVIQYGDDHISFYMYYYSGK